MKPNWGTFARIAIERCEELEARCHLLLREARRYREERDAARRAADVCALDFDRQPPPFVWDGEF